MGDPLVNDPFVGFQRTELLPPYELGRAAAVRVKEVGANESAGEWSCQTLLEQWKANMTLQCSDCKAIKKKKPHNALTVAWVERLLELSSAALPKESRATFDHLDSVGTLEHEGSLTHLQKELDALARHLSDSVTSAKGEGGGGQAAGVRGVGWWWLLLLLGRNITRVPDICLIEVRVDILTIIFPVPIFALDCLVAIFFTVLI
jgi:hypothetical protein